MGVVIIVIAVYSGAVIISKKGDKPWTSLAFSKKDSEGEKRQDHTEAKVVEIARLVKGLEEQRTREELLKKYPLGYVVFDLEYTNTVLPYVNQLTIN